MTDYDDELRVNGELQALAADLDRVVDGRNPSRGASLEVARRYRALHASLPDNSTLKAVVGLAMVAAAERVTRAQGTAAWDEPETVEEAKARMGQLPAAPDPGVRDRVNERKPDDVLVDAELAEMEYRLQQKADEDKPEGTLKEPVISAKLALQLVAEVRRLRAPVANADIERVLENALGDMEMNEHERCVGEKEHAAAQAQQEDLRRVVRSAARELERLRSDEWLEKAVAEIYSETVGICDGSLAEDYLLAILRKHRDGKA